MAHHSPLVAVVDDEESVRKALCRLFAATRLDVVSFPSGDDFIASLDRRMPDCIVLDLQMPGLTGFDVQAQLLNRGLSIPLIILTGHDEPGIHEQCFAMGASAYLRKPVHDETLLEAVRRVTDWPEPAA